MTIDIKPVRIFSGSSGLNTVDSPVRAKYDPSIGIHALSKAVNIVIDNTGRVSRRQGYEVLTDGPIHSLFCDGGDCLFVADNILHQLQLDESTKHLRTDLIPGQRIDYTQVGSAIYYTSPSAKGIVEVGGVHKDWIDTPYVGPSTNKTFIGPILAQHISFFASRVFLSNDNYIVFSEPFGWSLFDLARSVLVFDSRIRMMKPVAGGVFISTDKKMFFLNGVDPKTWQLIEIAGYPALEWSAAIDLVDGTEIGIQEPGLCALWVSEQGVCLGTASGVLHNLTKDKVVYPVKQTGASLLTGYSLIQTLGV